jgi:hypothetical protein
MTPDFFVWGFLVIFTYNQLNLIKMDKETCKHEKTYVAVRHVSGIKLVKCSHCGKVIN